MSEHEKLDLSIIGYSGLKQWSGLIDEEWSTRLKGSSGVLFYREMADSSSTIGAILWVIEALIRQVEWRVEPADDSEEAETAAQLVEECFVDMDETFEDFLAEVLSELVYGYSYFEVLYKLRKGDSKKEELNSRYNDGKIGWRNFALRSQDSLDRWQIDERGNIQGMIQRDPVTGTIAFVPIEKALHFRIKKSKNNPEGKSLLRNAVTDYLYYKNICKIEAIGIERDMTGLLVMEVPEALLHTAASPAQKALLIALEQMLGQLKRDEREYAIVPAEMTSANQPSGFKLKLLTSGGRRQIDTEGIKRGYKIGMLQSLLAQFLELGTSTVGSFALASSATDLFAASLGAVLGSIAATFNAQAIQPLMRLNGIASQFWPDLMHGDLDERPLGELGQYLTALASSGQLPDDPALQRKLLEIARLPIPPAETSTDEMQPGIDTEKKKVKKHVGGLKCTRAHRWD